MEANEEYYSFIGNKRDTFMDTTMQELTKLKDRDLRTTAASNSQIKLKGNKYYVGEGKDIHARRLLHALHRSLCHLARHPHGHAHRNKMATLIVSSTCSTGACTTRN